MTQWARWRDERLQADTAAGAVAAGSAGLPPAAAEAASAPSNALPFGAPAQALRPPPGVALSGRRLKRGVPWAAVVVFAILVLFWLAGQFEYFGLFVGP